MAKTASQCAFYSSAGRLFDRPVSRRRTLSRIVRCRSGVAATARVKQSGQARMKPGGIDRLAQHFLDTRLADLLLELQEHHRRH